MKTWLMGTAGAVLLFSFSAAGAQDTGFYLGASIGQADYRSNCTEFTTSCDTKDTAWRVAGGYQFNRYLAVELGYADLGGPKTSTSQTFSGGSFEGNTDSKVTAWDLSAVALFPLVQRLFGYGRAAIYRAEVEGTANFTTTGSATVITPASGSISETNTGVILGIGLRYELLPSLALRAEWQRYFEVGEESKVDVDVIGAGLLYRF
jgi:OmpA-OmpF porin, OOP family